MRFCRCPGPIRALTFDLDDTLYNNIPVLDAAEEWFAQYLTDTYRLPPACREYAFWAEIKSKCAQDNPALKNDVTELRAQALVAAFMQLRCPLAGGLTEARALVEVFVKRRSQVQVPPSSRALLTKLKERLPLAAVSNGNVSMAALGLGDLFEFDLRPQLTPGRARKPYPDLFHEAARRFGVSSHEILHVGDEPLTDVHGAIRAGCQCAWLQGGIAGLSPGDRELKVLPTVILADLSELLLLTARRAQTAGKAD